MPRLANRFVRPVFATTCAAALVLGALASRTTEAHKAITSKYTYNADVFPIFRDRCGTCHAPDGAAPMSLLSYKDAVPWAESLREELVSEKMPPWYVDEAGPKVLGGHPLSPREVDTIVTWATGGTPEGDPSARPTPRPLPYGWSAGKPDLVLQMEVDHTLAAGVMEDTVEFSLPTGLGETRWVKAADLLPGKPSMVRRATIAVENGPTLALWMPGHDALGAPAGTAFLLPANAKLHVRIYYKKPWQEEQSALSDRSSIGLYFTGAPASGDTLEAVTLKAEAKAEPAQAVAITQPVATGMKVVAIRPLLDQPYATIDVHALLPDGSRQALLRLRAPRPDWPRRYWLATPVTVPNGAKIEVAATAAPPDSENPAPKPAETPVLQVAIDYAAH